MHGSSSSPMTRFWCCLTASWLLAAVMAAPAVAQSGGATAPASAGLPAPAPAAGNPAATVPAATVPAASPAASPAAGPAASVAPSAGPVASPSAAPAASSSAEQRAVEESPLTTYVFRDDVGNLVEMPNFSFSDFEKAYKLLQGLTQQDPRPRFSIQWMSLAGEAHEDHASMELTARVLVRERNWVRVPLRLDQAMVREPLETSEAVEAYLHPESEGEGYVCYLR
ncbi:MAG: hypothetical protein U1E05_20455, partial [Patescibacteria group bacterium]|nr:hypothetical protein [Patescibacteria group bacterium]